MASMTTLHGWTTLHSKSDAKKACRIAFSLIELLVVLLIVAILSAIATPKIDHALKSARSRSVAHWIKSDLNFAQRHARRTCTNQTVSFDVANHAYTMTGISDIDQRGQSYVTRLNDSRFQARLVSADFGGSSSITFNIHGQPSNAGTVVVSSGNLTKTIVINTLGQVNIL